MTCSTSIVHFNFPLNSEINLNSIDKDNYLSPKESSQIISSDIDKSDDLEAGQESHNIVKQMIKSKSQLELNSKLSIVNENLEFKVNNSSSNMNNGLSNGHDLNLGLDHSGITLPQSNSASSYSTTELSSGTVTINPVSSISSSCSNSNTFFDTSETMGILSTTDKHNLPQNLLIFNDKVKIENGQKLALDDPEWTNVQPKLVDKVNILPQINLSSNEKQTSPCVEEPKNCNQTNDNLSKAYLIKRNVNQETNLCQNFNSNIKLDSVDCSLKSHLCSSEISNSPNQQLFLDNSVPDSVPNESTSDLCVEQQGLQNLAKQLNKRIRRVQLQHSHRNINKQMKIFMSLQQNLNSINCQSFNFDFSNYLQTSTTNASQLKELLLQKDLTKNEKQCISDTNLPYSSIQQPQYLSHLSSNDVVHSLKSSNNAYEELDDNVSQYSMYNTLTTPLQNQYPDFSSNKLSSLSTSNHIEGNSLFINQQKSSIQCNFVPKTLSQESKEKILSTIDTLRFNLRHLESKYDSDATDSSSGGESCDEFDDDDIKPTYSVTAASISSTSTVKKYIPIRERSKWKWCNERSAIASRWSWLHAHITDLETKLRQQNEIFRHLRATKGSICFGENEANQRYFPSVSSQNSSNINSSNSNQQTASTLMAPGSNAHSSSYNPMVHQNSIPENNEQDVSIEEENSCMRTMPFQSMKRRKLVLTEKTLSLAMRKSVKYSSIQCSCNLYMPFVPPCVICNGRYSYMHSIETDFMPYCERVSLLDSSCHPILCLPNEVSLGLHFMQLLKRESINNNRTLVIRSKKKKIPANISADSNSKSKKLLPPGTPSKIKKKSDIKSKKRRLSGDSAKKIPRDRLSSGCSSRAESPVPSPSPSDASSNGAPATNQSSITNSAPLNRRRRSEQHAFDINNIVIPYSIAASTRVEKLQYKEILTPKWRVNEDFSIPPPEFIRREIVESISNDLENITDEEFIERHSKCEESERQRIMSYYVGLTKTKSKNVRKGTSRVRFESNRSESADQSSQDSCSSKVKSKAKNDYLYERKRHSSFSKSLSRDDTMSEDIHEMVVSPYEPRHFPLNDEIYQDMMQEISDEALKEEMLANFQHETSKNCTDVNDSTDEDTHVNSIVSSPSNTELENSEDYVSGKVNSQRGLDTCEDDPEWKPTKI